MKILCGFAFIVSIPVWGQVSPIINDFPSREFGQAKLLNPPVSGAPNLTEGRELNAPTGMTFSSSGAMYVADTSNNRVLAWRSAPTSKGAQADVVIGQRDFYSTFQQGPGGQGRNLSSGLALPESVAVDRSGNVYVLDGANSRILRYPNPFTQTNTPLLVDLVIGQKTQSSGNTPNEGNVAPSSKTVAFVSGNVVLPAGIALDAQGNLWVTDAVNNRVLRYPVSQLAAGTVEPAADIVLGQPDFVTNTVANCGNICQTTTTVLLQPQSLAFDGAGALYVADGFARVLYYPNPSAGLPATKVLGVPPAPVGGQTAKPFPNEYSLGNNLRSAPLGVFASGTQVFVADTLANRVVHYTSPTLFSPTDIVPSPKIEGVVGQADLLSGKSNRGQAEPDAATLSSPASGAFDSAGNLWVVDKGNNRVLSYSVNGTFISNGATVVVGQTDFPFNAVNLIEGREVWIAANDSTNSLFGGGIAVDKTSNPPHLYIADTFNNRILGFRDARAVGADARSILTQKADLVIGQADLFRAVVNYPGGDPDLPTQTGLLRPVGLVVDDGGNLWVADSGNGRVLHFPAPFNVAAGSPQSADLVLGQRNFTQKDQSATAQTMSSPYGLALFPGGHLAVSDSVLNRVLVFQKPFTNGQTAFSVVGQQNFASGSASGSLAGLNIPRHVATDSSGRLYVSDFGNSRLMVYQNTSNIPQTGPSANFNFPIPQPQGLAVSSVSSEMWVGSGSVVLHLPEVNTFQTTATILQQIASSGPMAIALDGSENPVVAEAINRVAFYFAKLEIRNAFSFTLNRSLTPGMWVTAAPIGKQVNVGDEFHTPPYPNTVQGLQVLVNGAPSGIYGVAQKAYINFIVPWSAPTTGSAEFLLFNSTTKEIVAAGTYFMAVADPAFKTVNGAGWGQVLATNDDGTLNGPQNPIGLGKTMTLALTGQGLVNNPPADGVAPASQTPTNPGDLKIFLNGIDINQTGGNHVVFSGLDSTYPGSWTVSFRLPTVAEGGPPPSNSVPIVITFRDVPSNWGYDPNNGLNDILLTVPNGRITTIAVK